MSYDNMNHVEWLTNRIASAQKRLPSPRERRAKINGKGWFAAPDKLNAFQRRTFTILGIVGSGLYNAPINWDSLAWSPDYLIISWRVELATRDFRALTDLVFLAHDAAIRIAISPNMRSLQITMHQRKRPPEGGSVFQGHPTAESAMASHRARFPLDHPVHLEAAPSAAPNGGTE